MKKISILFLILLCNCTFLYAQQFSITGVVTDKKLNEPIIGASVVVKGTTNGTVTDLDGKFTIQASKSSSKGSETIVAKTANDRRKNDGSRTKGQRQNQW